MNISYNWLKDLIQIYLPADELAAQLTRVGLAVEGIHPVGDDFVLDIDVTSNRPDCLSHRGMAREVGVITGAGFKPSPHDRDPLADAPYPSILAPDIVRIEAPELCHRFTARILKNVKVGPSPAWLVERLEAVGERSINNIADITNYVMLETGQPMHAFDLDKLAEHRIVVRRAKPGESIATLDGVDRKLDGSMVMICDAENPVAVGGVMGGLDSSITDSTENVLLEVAFFDPENIRKTSRKLGLVTEASYRFERGVDIENLKRASDRAASLIVELAGADDADLIDVYRTKRAPVEIVSQDIPAAVARLTGLTVAETEALRILNSLGIRSEESADSSHSFTVPSWRHDLAVEEDLVEEVARHTGYELIGTELPPAFHAGEYQPSELRERLLRRSLASLSFDEAVSYSFIDTDLDGVFETVAGLHDENAEEKYITLQDSVIVGAVRMRPTLLPGLLDAVRLNFNHQRRTVRLFEIGKVFASSGGEDGLPIERKLLSMVITGSDELEGRSSARRELDFYDAKGAVEAALSAVGIERAIYGPAEVTHLRTGQSASIAIDGVEMGTFGRLNEEIGANYKFKQPIYVVEIDLQAVLAAAPDSVFYQALPKYPSVIRDVSLAVSRSTQLASVLGTLQDHGQELCRSVSFVDLYEGKGLSDERSLTIRLEYRSDDRTLVEAEVDAAHDAILAVLSEDLGIEPRK